MRKQIIYAAIAALFFLSCGKTSENKAQSDQISDQEVNGVFQKEQTPAAPGSDQNKEKAESPKNKQQPQIPAEPVKNLDWDKKIIKTANVALELKDYNMYNKSIHEKAKSFGGYIAQEQQAESDYKIENDITIKIPVDQFDNLMNALGGEGVKVIDKNITSEDVTGEVFDTKARIEAKKQVRERYLALLKQAKNMEEILNVQKEIDAIQIELESATGRIDYLLHASAYSTIHVRYYQYFNEAGKENEDPGFFKRVANAFSRGSSLVGNMIIGLITLWPLLLSAVVLFFFIRRLRLKRS